MSDSRVQLKSPSVSQTFAAWVIISVYLCGEYDPSVSDQSERTQCLMVMIQDGQFLNAPEKPLHIIRDPMRVQRGRDLVQDL